MAGRYPRRNPRRAKVVQEMEGIHGNEAHQCELSPGLGLNHVLAFTPEHVQDCRAQASSKDGNERHSNETIYLDERDPRSRCASIVECIMEEKKT